MVEISFYLLSSIAILMLLLLFRDYSLKMKLTAFLFIGAWLIYLSFLERSGILMDLTYPPLVPILIVTPAIIVNIVLVNRTFMRIALERNPLYLPILLQSFRILVELLIYATYQKGIFPQRATFEGLNFDILVGFTALAVAAGVYKGVIKRSGILAWNIISICILSLTAYSFISTYYFTDFATSTGNFKFVEFPYLLLASVMLPVAVFLHAFSIKQVLVRG